MVFVVHVCLIVADLMYITRGQVALYRARLDLLSTRTSQYTLSYPLPRALVLKCILNFTIIIHLALVTIITTFAVAIWFCTQLVLQIYSLLDIEIALVVILCLPLSHLESD